MHYITIKRKLQSLQQGIRESKSHSYLNINQTCLFYFICRLSLLINIDYFCGEPYKDDKFILLKSIINWIQLLQPLSINSNVHFVIIIILTTIHWLATFTIFIGFLGISFLRSYSNKYFTYFQVVLLFPTFLHLNEYKQNGGEDSLTIICSIPIALNYLILLYINRNYSLPSRNPYCKRYRITNYLIAIVDLVCLITLPYVKEEFQTIILMIQNSIHLIDSFSLQPYSQLMNIRYNLCCSILIVANIIKLIVFYKFEVIQFFYYFLFFSPLIGIISQKYQQYIYEAQLYNKILTKELILQVVDIYYGQNDFNKKKILYLLKNYHNLTLKHKNDNALQFCVIQLFAKLIDQIPIQERYNDEDLYIYKILFFYQTCEKYNLGYIKLKKYQTYSQRQSFYFQILSENIFLMVNKNNKAITQQTKDDTMNLLTLSEIRRSEVLCDKILPLAFTVLERKFKYWEILLQGYKNIEDMSIQSIALSKLISNIKKVVFSELSIGIFSIQKDVYKLNILDLRLISLVFSAVLNDYFITILIEQRIEEVLSYERNLQTKNIINTTLLHDEVILLTTSMVKNQGQILSSNRLKLQRFFCYPDESAFSQVQNISHLIPDYLKQQHSEMMDSYLHKGESKLFESSKDIFPVYYSGFLFNSTLQLVHTFDDIDDYVLTATIKKNTDSSDFILFDDSGKLLGISQSAQQLLLKSQDQEFQTILLKSYIFFWFQNLFEKISELQDDDINSSKQFQTTIQQTIIHPISDLDQIIREHEKYKRSHYLTNSNQNTIKTDQLDQTDHFTQQHIKYQCFSKRYISQTQDFLSCSTLKENTITLIYQIQYSLHLHVIGKSFPVFELKILDYKQKDTKKQGLTTLTGSSHYPITPTILPNDTQQLDDQHFLIDDEIYANNIVINQPVVNKLNNQSDSNINIKEDQSHALDYRESNLISPRGNKDILIPQEEDEDEESEIKEYGSNINKSSSQKEQKDDIIQIVIRERELQNEFHDDHQQKRSVSSQTSDKTQNSIYSLIRKLSYTEQYHSAIITVILTTLLMIFVIIILLIVELIIMRQNTNTLEYNVPLDRIPQRFNRLYCTITLLSQLFLQDHLLNISYGDYYEYRIQNDSQINWNEILAVMPDLKQEFSQLEQDGKLPIVTTRIINEYIYKEINSTMLEFDDIAFEYSSQISEILKLEQIEQSQIDNLQILAQFFKGNLVTEISLTNKLVEQIELEFFTQIDNFQIQYLVFLLVLIWIVLLVFIIHFKFWQQPYIYMQSVLVLISRIAERDIEICRSRVLFIQGRMKENQLQWKHINYFKEFYWFNRQNVRLPMRQVVSTTMNHTKKAISVRAKQTSRLQDATFSILNIYLILIFLCLLLFAYFISSYLVQKINMDNSQPELRLTMEYNKFKQELDGIITISQLLKNQQLLIVETMQSGIFQNNPDLNTTTGYFSNLYNELLEEFVVLFNDIDGIYQHLYNDVVASIKISDSNKQLLLNLYETDLCNIIPTQLPFCDYSNGQFKYFPTFPYADSIDNNKIQFLYGINGIYQELLQIFNTHYSQELLGLKDTNLTLISQFLQSSEFIQTLLSYSFDQSYAFLEFYYTVLQASLDILEADYWTFVIYVICFGIGCLIALISGVLIRALTLQYKVRLIRQTLVIIPHEALQDQSILSAVRRIDRSL